MRPLLDAALVLPLALAVPLALAGCGDIVAQAIGGPPLAAAADGGDASLASDGAVLRDTSIGPPTDGAADADDASLHADTGPGLIDASAFCQGHGPIPIGPGVCTGDLAHKFRFAACACASLRVSGQLGTDSFDSTIDAGVSPQAASIAANGSVSTNTHTALGGSVYAAGLGPQGAPAVQLRGDGRVARDIQAGGSLTVGGVFQAGGDVFAKGSVLVEDPDGGQSLTVARAVHVPDGGAVSRGVIAAGGVSYQPVQIDPPCDCSNPIDVYGIVRAHRDKQNNDDAAMGLTVTALDNPSSAVRFPCGRYYVDGILGGAVDLVVQGRVAIFVDGPVMVDGGLRITLEPNAELDLFVAGEVSILNAANIGNVNAPARVRMYVGGTMMTLTGSTNVGANVYAPLATVTLASDFEMWGSFFAQDFSFSGNFSIHYDTSVLGANGCVPPGGPCKTCDDCSGTTPACIGGTCGACRSDADCCTPLVCNAGLCVHAAQ